MKEFYKQKDILNDNYSVVADHFAISNFLQAESESEVVDTIFRGLSSAPKHISSRFFYDATGSRLFEEITTLPEYYPTRTEMSILQRVAGDVLSHNHYSDIVELGSGDCSKISVLLDACEEKQMNELRYFPVDVSEDAVLKSANELVDKYPGLKVHGILADFMKHLQILPGEGNRLICFFGSTLGNLENDQAIDFLRHVKRSMKKGDALLLGLDMAKDIRVLEKAYNDQQGITAKFNMNILQVVNQVAGTNFDPVNFQHMAFFNPERSRIEMHLKAMKEQVISSPHFSETIFIKKGETIHTENSRKFTHDDITELANASDLSIQGIYNDQKDYFSLVQLICNG
ncbi:MAG: L-histidine N(alpha)-methyltransferase [Bacteroidales bacterium]